MHKISIQCDQVEVEVTGPIDVKQATQLRSDLFVLVNKGHKKFVIDLTQTEYMDSTGLGVFVSLRNRLEHCDGNVRIHGLNGKVEQLFITTRLNEVFCA